MGSSVYKVVRGFNMTKEEEIPEGICCCCGHELCWHIDEGDGWRCHLLSSDLYQCECFLRKGRYESKDGYDLKSRVDQHIKEIKEGKG